MNDLAEMLEPTDAGDKVEVEAEVEAEQPKVETTQEETPETKEETPPPAEPSKEEQFQLSLTEQNRELRQLLRAQKRDLTIMQEKLARVEKRSAAATKQVDKEVGDDYESLFGTEGKEETAMTEELSPVEILQQELNSIAKVKGPILEVLIETMEMNPKYPDIREVCSQSNFQDMFDTVGEAVAQKEGKDPGIAAMEVETAVWKMPNPYKYMYDLIKKYHPRYAGKEEKVEATPAKAPTAKQAPTSLANVPGKTAGKNTWTAARIDELDEMELDTVPPEIYDKYLRGELD